MVDTTVFIARESGREPNAKGIPEEVATTVIPLAELETGVLAAADSTIRAKRLTTLQAVSDIEVFSVEESAAREWAQLRVHLAETGRRIRISDLWTAATATSGGLPVVTQDDDFSALRQRSRSLLDQGMTPTTIQHESAPSSSTFPWKTLSGS